jgi:hypothetical protein
MKREVLVENKFPPENSLSSDMSLTRRIVVSAVRGTFKISLASSGPRMIFTTSVKAWLCQQTQTLNLLMVVQGQCTMGCAADESGVEGGFSAP